MSTTYPGLFLCKPLIAEESKPIFNPKYPDNWNPSVYTPESGLGLLYCSPLENKIRENFIFDGKEVEFVDYWPTKVDGSPFNYIRGAYTEQVKVGVYEFHLVLVHISQVDLKTLKNMEVWKILSEDEKQKLETNNFVSKKIDLEVRSSKKGKKRNPEFTNLPRELKCSTKGCNRNLPYISPNVLTANANKLNLSIEEYVNNWKCPKCLPRKRGKQSSPEIDNLPREIKCSTEGCDGMLSYISPAMLVKKSLEKNMSIEEYIASYKCSKCEPKRRGRAPSEKWAGLPRELICPCGFVLKQHPSMTSKLAEAEGKSFEDFVNEYRCRKCKPETTTTTTTRGRRISTSSPWFGKAKELTCVECGKVQKQHASITSLQAQKANKSFDDYVSSWKCRDCRPDGEKRGRGRPSKKLPVINASGIEIPSKTICQGCKKVVSIVASNIIEKASILGIDPIDLVLNYKCRSCGGRITKKDKQNSK